MHKQNESVAWLNQYHSSQPRLGLERVEALLNLIGNPHLKVPVIHIGGTNGKGSTVTYLANLLMARGFRVGVFSSPYITSYEEQFQINQVPIKTEVLARYIGEYQALFQNQVDNEAIKGITEFELITVLAYQYFYDQAVDFVIMEVGLGGLLDSTNVCQPILTGITTIGLDHVAILGNTIEEIAYQKAGIIKEGVPIVTGNIPDAALQVIEKKAKEEQAGHFCLNRDYKLTYLPHKQKNYEEYFAYESIQSCKEIYHTPLLGRHQTENAAMAIQMFELLAQLQGFYYDHQIIQQALSQTKWPARMEIISEQPLVILDGAHNPHAIERLIENMAQNFQDKKVSILFSCIKTKDLTSMLTQMQQIKSQAFYLTSFNHEHAYSLEELSEYSNDHVHLVHDWATFVKDYYHQDHTNELLLITGSLYFTSQVRHYIQTIRQDVV
ncbi:bifunctional folylpolyglutamate synthase/dihydrofolate synthase [Vaginisenegalia massiliensis]|uniref:bifunctional folylpolyglutamate synthase/dihydrofolate synthase n=1 Tax=Vaginisenegalia massiliensis TaxID=2058294 RepID=UPI000F51BDF1|nr:folylpolyglutamate synthase/dihydrofolate synthase family protein [Vaginisenegalia massiliensis]